MSLILKTKMFPPIPPHPHPEVFVLFVKAIKGTKR